MDLQALFLSSSGRVSRKTWWMGTLILIVASIVLYFVLGLIGLGMTSAFGPIIAFLILVYPAYNLGQKRRQDRDNNGMDFKILMGLSALTTLLQAFGIGYTPTDLGNGMVVMMPGMLMSTVQIIVGIFGIYMLIQLGFLRGTPGSNSYGADPLGYAAA
jgi:uncharacterized membrane protein YhaH (DUF805 family)